MSGLHANNWTYGELEPGGEVEAYIIDSDGDMVAQFWAVESKDGRLMAAAPRLAEALKQLLDYTLACELVIYDTGEQDEEHRAVTAARAALREAGVEETGDN